MRCHHQGLYQPHVLSKWYPHLGLLLLVTQTTQVYHCQSMSLPLQLEDLYVHRRSYQPSDIRLYTNDYQYD